MINTHLNVNDPSPDCVWEHLFEWSGLGYHLDSLPQTVGKNLIIISHMWIFHWNDEKDANQQID